MSQRPSACIPPPTDYAPQPGPAKQFRERGGKSNSLRGLGRGYHQSQPNTHSQSQISFHKDDPDVPDRPKPQFQDKFFRNEDDDYFTSIQDDNDNESDSERLVTDERQKDAQNNDDDDDDDPLDAYMQSLEQGSDTTTKRDKVDQNDPDVGNNDDDGQHCNLKQSSASSSAVHDSKVKAVRLDIDSTDDIEESYYQYVEQKKGQSGDSDEYDERQNLVDYDKDGNVVSFAKLKKDIEPLPPIDHSQIEYEPFQKSFYNEHDEIRKLTIEQENELRSKLEIKVSGSSPPKPVCSFAHFRFEERLLKVIRRSEYTQPTPIQAQAIPAALLGRNIIGIAMTGSGKTAAYLWPMIVHIMGQPDLKHGDGPIGLVLVPTRELALQVYSEAKRFSSSYNMAVVCAYGGGSKYEQTKDLEAGAEIVVATPGRLIDLIKLKATNLRRVTYLVLDEADRFFEMGFELQVRSICDHIRPDRQTLLFSATFKHKIEQLARTVTDDPVKIVQKSLGEANEDVTQHVVILPDLSKKWNWLTERLVEFTSSGSVLIFVTRIVNSEELHKKLQDSGKEALLLHGDMEQSERNRVITSFKRKENDVLIATDVAARGLDIPHIRTVINYDVARDIDTHIHRIGRTGRAGFKGDAYTLLTDKDKEFSGHLMKNLESSNQIIDEDLKRLAKQSSVFKKRPHSSQYKNYDNQYRKSNPVGGAHRHRNFEYKEESFNTDQHSSHIHRHESHSLNRHKRDQHSHRGTDHYKDREREVSLHNHKHRSTSSQSASYDDDRKRHKWH